METGTSLPRRSLYWDGGQLRSAWLRREYDCLNGDSFVSLSDVYRLFARSSLDRDWRV